MVGTRENLRDMNGLKCIHFDGKGHICVQFVLWIFWQYEGLFLGAWPGDFNAGCSRKRGGGWALLVRRRRENECKRKEVTEEGENSRDDSE